METINNIPQFIDYIQAHNLTSKEICQVLHEGFMVFADEEKTPEVLVSELREYSAKWGNKIERPLFLNLELDVIE